MTANPTPQERLDAMVRAIPLGSEDTWLEASHNALAEVALDLLSKLDAAEAQVDSLKLETKALTAERIELVKKALACLVVWRCVVCRHDLHEMPISPSGPCPKCGKSSHFQGLFSDDREGLVALLRAALKGESHD